MIDVLREIERACIHGGDVLELYHAWWGGSIKTAPPTALRDAGEQNVQFHTPSFWQRFEQNDDGSVVVTNGGEVAHVPAGEWIGQQTDVVSVVRRQSWTEGWFSWRLSRRPRPPTALRWRIRLYLPSPRGQAFTPQKLMDGLGSALDDEYVWYEAKAWLGAEKRRDAVVVWVAARDLAYVMPAIEGVVPPGAGAPPPLTLPLGDAKVGAGADPPDGGSLGLLLCSTVIAADDGPRDCDLATRWEHACRFFGVDSRRPWRHVGCDPFRTWSSVEPA